MKKQIEKVENYYLTKDISEGAIKDVDTVTGIVTGYFSIFGNKDSDGDIVMPGAFKRSINANGPTSEHPRILHLYMHNTNQPLSKPSVLKEDKTGLYFESTISHTTLGKDVIQLYQDKVLTEHSIGYQVVKREVDDSDKDRVQKLMELKLWEGSTVSWGANADALVTSVKDGRPDKKMWNKFLAMMNSLDEALKGNYSDDTARQLEIQFKQFQQVVMSLATNMDSLESTPEVDNPKTVTAEWIYKHLTKNIHL
jgi:uncharacterized protein